MLPTVLPGSMGTSSSPARSLGILALGLRFTPVNSAASIGLPPSFETFAKNDRRRVHHHQEREQHDDRARGLLDESTLGAVRPEKYLHGKHRRRIGDAFRNVD